MQLHNFDSCLISSTEFYSSIWAWHAALDELTENDSHKAATL